LTPDKHVLYVFDLCVSAGKIVWIFLAFFCLGNRSQYYFQL
jgi:hypothetical protein